MDLRAAVVGLPSAASKSVGGVSDGEFAAGGPHLLGLGFTSEARKSWSASPARASALTRHHEQRPGACPDGVDNPQPGRGRRRSDRRFPLGPPRRPRRPEPPGAAGRLRALRADRTGAWSDIHPTSSTERVPRRPHTLWLDHGTALVDACYAYLPPPGASPAPSPIAPATAGGWRSATSGGAWQAVAVRSPGLTAADFWQPGTVGPLTASAQASALVRSNRRTAILHISEPPRTGVPPEITRHHPVPEVNSEDVSVEVLATGRSPRL
ncbi:polysaccharide lyase family 8 super-sandwich domain-containing protein [Streptomyces sp. NPDC001820]|uniref:polysaccharide lyase family 8 super-sandwich domain-containing protein n=1 Tax=Streptomyces sp. NPDC001820 TaxID=3364613 RepID=UPI0036C10A69